MIIEAQRSGLPPSNCAGDDYALPAVQGWFTSSRGIPNGVDRGGMWWLTCVHYPGVWVSLRPDRQLDARKCIIVPAASEVGGGGDADCRGLP